MWNEHFGIGVVEYMAAGLVAVAHASGGPLMDIVVPLNDCPTGSVFLYLLIAGYLATTKEEFASKMHQALQLSDTERRALQHRARQAVLERFSNDAFQYRFVENVRSILKLN